MRIVRISACLGAAALVAMTLSGCNSQSNFTQQELDAMKHKGGGGGIPPGAMAANADKMKQAQQLYLESLKRRGLTPGQNGAPMPPGMAAPSSSGPTQSAAGGTK
ncbi:MAG TPA: hypothetical protein VKU00_30620 [Chthonomonadaceae bacterium]|nr:hypothetical protein [Chthonomonadaceae bacterium]